MAAQQLPAALDLMRRLPPRALRDNLSAAVALVPDLIEDLLSSVDQPLEVMRCPDTQKEFILCDYNRDGDSYRSPWSNKYTPALEDDGVTPSDELRRLEMTANDAFDQYREQYYEGGVSSCYFWDNEGGFACCVVIKKDAQPKAHLTSEDADPNTAKVSSGAWNSIHVVETNVNEGEKRTKYKLTTTIMLSLDTSCKAEGSSADLSGNLTRAMEKEKPFNPSDLVTHISNIGEMIEEMEGRMRSTLEEVYFGKTKEVVAKVREGQDERKVQQQSLMAEMAARRNG